MAMRDKLLPGLLAGFFDAIDDDLNGCGQPIRVERRLHYSQLSSDSERFIAVLFV